MTSFHSSRRIEFQFTHPGGVRPQYLLADRPLMPFQFTHPGGVRPSSSSRASAGTTFQFTHPGGVRPCGVCPRRLEVEVSIHAPGRGATAKVYQGGKLSISFNSRTREGCDICLYGSDTRHCRFNSRTREGCDKLNEKIQDWEFKFQFTHPGGVRPSCFQRFLRLKRFQFTHPGGVRRTSSRRGRSQRGFNSRTREGCDC